MCWRGFHDEAMSCRWKESSNRNQMRYSESIKILKEMKEMYDQ